MTSEVAGLRVSKVSPDQRWLWVPSVAVIEPAPPFCTICQRLYAGAPAPACCPESVSHRLACDDLVRYGVTAGRRAGWISPVSRAPCARSPSLPPAARPGDCLVDQECLVAQPAEPA